MVSTRRGTQTVRVSPKGKKKSSAPKSSVRSGSRSKSKSRSMSRSRSKSRSKSKSASVSAPVRYRGQKLSRARRVAKKAFKRNRTCIPIKSTHGMIFGVARGCRKNSFNRVTRFVAPGSNIGLMRYQLKTPVRLSARSDYISGATMESVKKHCGHLDRSADCWYKK